MKRRVLTIGLAVLLAALGTTGLLIYVNQADARAVAGQQPVTVLVAAKQVPGGTPAGQALSAGLLHSLTLPAGSVPPDAVESITPDLTGLVTSTDLPPGQLLLRQMLVGSAAATGGLRIPEGMLALSVKLCMAEGVAGNVAPGSKIVVFDTVLHGNDAQLKAKPGCDGDHQQQYDGPVAVTRVLLPRVDVLAVGTSTGAASSSGIQNTAATTSTDPNAGLLLTVAVSQADAARLITATQTGLPYLALLGDTKATPGPVDLPMFP